MYIYYNSITLLKNNNENSEDNTIKFIIYRLIN